MLYKLVFDFILPVYRTTKKVKQGFREMNERMRQHTEGFAAEKPQVEKQKNEGTRAGDYIEFEELKDEWCISLFLQPREMIVGK